MRSPFVALALLRVSLPGCLTTRITENQSCAHQTILMETLRGGTECRLILSDTIREQRSRKAPAGSDLLWAAPEEHGT